MEEFERVRRGYSPKQVEETLSAKDEALLDAQQKIDALNEDLQQTQSRLEKAQNLDEDTLTEFLGTSAARLLNAARREAEAKEQGAKSEAEEILNEARREAEEVHRQAEKAFSERIAAAKAEAEKLEAEAQSARHQTLLDMNRERKEAKAEVQRLKAGRDKLLNSVDVSQRLIDEMKTKLTHSLSEAKIAADSAARKVMNQPDPSPAEIEEELAAAKLLELPRAFSSPDSRSPAPASPEPPGPSSEPPDPPSAPLVRNPFAELDEAAPESTASEPPEKEKGAEYKAELETEVEVEMEAEIETEMETEETAEIEGRQETETDVKTEIETSAETAAVGQIEQEKKPKWGFRRKPKIDDGVESGDGIASAKAEGAELDSTRSLFEKLKAEQTRDESKPPVEAESSQGKQNQTKSQTKSQTESQTESEEAKEEPEKEAGEKREMPIIDLPTAAPETSQIEDVSPIQEPEEPEEPASPEQETPQESDAFSPLADTLERQLKQAMAIDQNQVLDILRQKRKKELPPVTDQTAVYVSAINIDELNKTAETELDASSELLEELLEELWVQPLRTALEKCLPAENGTAQKNAGEEKDIATEVRTAFRNFKQTKCSKIALELSKKVLDTAPVR